MKAIDILAFVGGIAIGAVSSYVVVKKQYEQKMNDQIDELRTMYDERVEKIEASRKALDEMNAKKQEMMHELEEKVKQDEETPVGPTDYNSISKPKKQAAKAGNVPIKIITESEAQHYSKDYEIVGLTLYSDDVLIDDETENIIEDYADWIGMNGIDDIRKSDGESIYILNEEREAIYDITVIDERFGDDDELVQIH